MPDFKILTNWPDSEHQILELIKPFASGDNFAILYNQDPEIEKVYITTPDHRMILALESAFDLEEVDSIDYGKDFMLTSNRKWGVIGNRSLVNF